jgi:hypothetical protein
MLDDDLVYMRMNTMMMEKSNTSEGQDLEPIDLYLVCDQHIQEAH